MNNKDKNNLPNLPQDDYLDHCGDALHHLTRQAEQALRTKQN